MFRIRTLLLSPCLALAVACAPSDASVDTADDAIRIANIQTPFGPLDLKFEIVDGLAIHQGDIELFEVDGAEHGNSSRGLRAAGIAKPQHGAQWPGGVVPYVIDDDLPNQQRVFDAIAQIEANTSINLVLRTNQDDYIEFTTKKSNCSSAVGRQGGKQKIRLAAGCFEGQIVHEIAHALGMWHEQSRSDRDTYIQINEANILDGDEHNFDKHTLPSGRNFGPYDLGSIMHYGPNFFSNGTGPTISLIGGGAFVANTTALSNGDIATIQRLYGFGAGSDYDGDGFGDLAIGVPWEGAGAIHEGALEVFYGSATGAPKAADIWYASQTQLGGAASPYANLGSAVANGDFDGDGYDDVAVGAPGASVGGEPAVGEVRIFYGSASGLSSAGAQLFDQSTPGVPGDAEAQDAWASSLTTGDFNGDGYGDLVIGASREAVGAKKDAGAVTVLYGTAAGLLADGAKMFHRGTDGVDGAVGSHDRFGAAVEAGDFDNDGYDDLAIGVPGEDVGQGQSAGAVNVLYGSEGGLSSVGDMLFHKDTSGVEGPAVGGEKFGSSLAAGDFDGDDYIDLAIGVPYEVIGGIAAVGSVNVIYGSEDGLDTDGDQRWHQDSEGVGGTNEYGDLFGAALAAGDLDRDGRDDLVIGVPGDSVGTIFRAGAVTVIYGTKDKLGGADSVQVHQNTNGIKGGAEPYDRFGSAVSVLDLDGDAFGDLIVGVPNEDVRQIKDAGAVAVIFGGKSGLTSAGDLLLHQDSTGAPGQAEAGDELGRALP